VDDYVRITGKPEVIPADPHHYFRLADNSEAWQVFVQLSDYFWCSADMRGGRWNF
jgi:hypothetical protein